MKYTRRSFVRSPLLTVPPLFCCAALNAASDKSRCFVYVGAYTRQSSKGIYVYRFYVGTGKLDPLGLAAEAVNPGVLAVHPTQRFVYCVDEGNSFEGKKTGSISAFAIDGGTGRLTLLNRVASGGSGPAHLIVDKTGKHVLVANYGAGSAAVLPLDRAGRLREVSSVVQHHGSSVDKKRQEAPHPHGIFLSPDNRFALVADLGLDEVLVYRFEAANGSLHPVDPPYAKVKPGAGPRHFTFHPKGGFGYVINELQSTVTVFAWDGNRGVLNELQTISTLPKGFVGANTTAEIEIHRSGKFLYGSNRGHNSIALFAIDSATGGLTPVQHVSTQGQAPRSFKIDLTGSYLLAANEQSDNLVVFRIDTTTGRLSPTGQVLEVGTPACVQFAAAD